MNRKQFLFSNNPYHGKVEPEHPEVLLFNANLQEFAVQVGYISSLETGGKLSPEEAYAEVKALWKELKHSTKELGIANRPDAI
ncbi:MAG: hypothetical protein J7642_14465 [Cyanobacteria bacterium SBC]|nr:hypothetical protein [Cyanobacteria bacterium SBC]